MLALIPALIQLVPSLVSVFAGDKTGQSVQKALDVVKSVLPGVDLSSPEAFDSALTQADPKAMAALKTSLAQFAHEEAMAQIKSADDERERQHQEVLAQIQDLSDARKRDLAVRQVSGGGNTRANLMIIGDVIGLLSCLAAMVYMTWLGVHNAATGEGSPLIMAINGPLGMLTQQFGISLRDAHQFEFGSSRGSEAKNALLVASTGAKAA